MKFPPIILLVTLVLTAVLRAQETATEAPVAAEPTPAESTAPAAQAPVISAEDTAGMESKIGTEVIVEGIVRGVGKAPNDSITFLNFGDRRTGFVAVVFRAAYEKFPEGFDKYSQQKVRVRGQLDKYRDRQVQMKIFTPDQIEIVASETP